MTREEAIKWLKDYIENTPFQMEQYERAFDMAIEALGFDYKTAFQIACALLNGDILYGTDAESIFSEIMKKDGCVCSRDYENYILTHLNELRDDKALSQEPTEKPMCDRNICISNEYNGIGCDKCIVNKAEQEPCDDAISRESVDHILRDMGMNCAYDMPSFWANKGKDYKVIPTKWHKGYQQAVADFEKRIRELPSVTHKSGHWISHREHCENLGVMPSGLGAYEWCSNCDCGIDVREWHRNNYNYCPNCGARMESEDKE